MVTEIWATEIGTLCTQRRWTRQRLIHELRRAARSRNVELPADPSWRADQHPGQFVILSLPRASGHADCFYTLEMLFLSQVDER